MPRCNNFVIQWQSYEKTREEQKKKTYFFFIPSASNFSEAKVTKSRKQNKRNFFLFYKNSRCKNNYYQLFVYLLPPCGSMSTAYW